MKLSLKNWSEFLFDFWKLVKKYDEDVDFDKLIQEVNALGEKYPQNLFRGFLFGFLEQKSMEAIRCE